MAIRVIVARMWMKVGRGKRSHYIKTIGSECGMVLLGWNRLGPAKTVVKVTEADPCRMCLVKLGRIKMNDLRQKN